MPRGLILAVVFGSCAAAAIWPEKLGEYQLKASMEPHWFFSSSDPPEINEFGREDAEEADYGSFQVTAERFKDSTGAYAASLEMQETPLQVGNYLITCTGKCPKNLAALAETLPKLYHAPLPSLKSYLPSKNMLAHSERYIMSPASLHASLPQISESAVALQFGTEGEMARYRTPKGEETLAVFSYPTPEIARQQTPAFEAIPGAVVKRTGPLVALALPSSSQPPADRAEAEKLLSQVNYQGSVSWNEPLPLIIRPQTVAQMVLSILSLSGIVLGFCLASGLAFGAVRVVARRFGYSDAGTSLTTLHLGGK
jgi:hypothetical protein